MGRHRACSVLILCRYWIYGVHQAVPTTSVAIPQRRRLKDDNRLQLCFLKLAFPPWKLETHDGSSRDRSIRGFPRHYYEQGAFLDQAGARLVRYELRHFPRVELFVEVIPYIVAYGSELTENLLTGFDMAIRSLERNPKHRYQNIHSLEYGRAAPGTCQRRRENNPRLSEL